MKNILSRVNSSLFAFVIILGFFWGVKAFEQEKKSLYATAELTQLITHSSPYREPAWEKKKQYSLGLNLQVAETYKIDQQSVFRQEAGSAPPAWKYWNLSLHHYYWLP